jgi:hypothetical protein
VSLPRDSKIDLLRFLGLSAIVLAHVQPPRLLFQLRNFDVPLMVLVSGAAFGVSSSRELDYRSYLSKRIRRLLIPVWIFLTIVFCLQLCASEASVSTSRLSAKIILGSYLLTGGIGYVWIFRVFLLVALLAPVIDQANRKVSSHLAFFLLVYVAYIFYAVALVLAGHLRWLFLAKMVGLTVFYAWPYSLVFAVGLRLPSLPRKGVLWLGVLNGTVFLVLGVSHYLEAGRIVGTQLYKYPPSAYYLSYALCACCVAWRVGETASGWLTNSCLSRIVKFTGSNSDWVYLWHIPFLGIVTLPYYLKMPVVLALAMVLTAFQVAFGRPFIAKLRRDRMIGAHPGGGMGAARCDAGGDPAPTKFPPIEISRY